jgi:hypothetical protein
VEASEERERERDAMSMTMMTSTHFNCTNHVLH